MCAGRQDVDANLVAYRECIGPDIKSLCMAVEGFESRRDILRSPDFERAHFEPVPLRLCLHLAHLQQGAGIAAIRNNRQSFETWDNLTQELQSLPGKIRRLNREAGHITARPCEAGDVAGPDRVIR